MSRLAIPEADRGKRSPSQEINRLSADIRSWQARTGRTDIQVSESRHLTPASTADQGRVRSLTQRGPVDPCCTSSCPSVPDFEPLGKICILTSPVSRNGVRICTYTCYDVDRH